MFCLTALPARQGDALWIEYGDPGAVHRILVDGGSSGTREAIVGRIDELPAGDCRLDLVVVTHIDGDHIDGVVGLLEDDACEVIVDDIWFNGFPHLPHEHEVFGPIAGERLTQAIVSRGQTWNGGLPFGPAIAVGTGGALPIREVAGGLRLTILSPGAEQLAALRPVWCKVVRKAGLDPQVAVPVPKEIPGWETLGAVDLRTLLGAAFEPDRSVANGTSIALLAEYTDNRREIAVLLAGDAHAAVLEDSLRRLLDERGLERLRLDAFKLPHHGSKKNISRALIELVECPRFIFSTNGAYHRHPDAEAVARVVACGRHDKSGPELVFNYRTRFNETWDNQILMNEHGYSVRFPDDQAGGIEVELP